MARWWSELVRARWALERRLPQVRSRLRELAAADDQDVRHVRSFHPSVSHDCVVMRLDEYTPNRAVRLEKLFAAGDVRVPPPNVSGPTPDR